MKRCLFLIIIILISLNLISAHQPRLVFDKNISEENPYIILNPEVSQAFYGELKGTPEYFVINSNQRFNFYLQILSPDISNAKKDFSLEITNNNQKTILEPNQTEWKIFYEKFGGDSYLQGSEIEKSAESGKYLIKVSNPKNIGKYVLVIGKKESFPFNEAINAIFSMPKIKIYFNKSPLTAFFNIMGLFLLIIIILLLSLILIIIFLIKRFVRKK